MLRDVVITRYMFTLTTPLVRNGYLAENMVLPKKKSSTVRMRFVQVVCCNFPYTNFNVYIEKFYLKRTVVSSSSPVKNY